MVASESSGSAGTTMIRSCSARMHVMTVMLKLSCPETCQMVCSQGTLSFRRQGLLNTCRLVEGCRMSLPLRISASDRGSEHPKLSVGSIERCHRAPHSDRFLSQRPTHRRRINGYVGREGFCAVADAGRTLAAGFILLAEHALRRTSTERTRTPNKLLRRNDWDNQRIISHFGGVL
ncbi:hypothetical protein FA95DRAFT_109352 [Auriscalpium vulgare]|uniref:Uncharacterized protein n=1 Tax=Auriscalpium vulgare TaxID=40419 RepID=A0ACB8S7C0_9AGAM|nr:hypothetical protein FA95DRAFT_109352 [Auriscalpium vulgare]